MAKPICDSQAAARINGCYESVISNISSSAEFEGREFAGLLRPSWKAQAPKWINPPFMPELLFQSSLF